MQIEGIQVLMGFVACVVITRYTIPVILRVSRLKNLYDDPDERKAGASTVPLLGGIAIFMSFVLSVILFSENSNFAELKYILASAIILFFIGIKDDILVISPTKKFLAQLLAALILILLADIRITHLHGFLTIREINFVSSILLTLVLMVGIINAMNLIDGIDGLASGIGIVSSLAFGTWFYWTGHFQYALMAVVLAGGLGVFFYYNVFSKTHKIFMGDTGSLLIGLIISIFVIQFNEFNVYVKEYYAFNAAPAIALAILIVPVFDTLRVVVIRMKRGKCPFSPDKNHIHHQLLELGYTHFQVTLRILAANLFFIGLTLLIREMGYLAILMVNLSVAFFLTLILDRLVYLRKKEFVRNNGLIDLGSVTSDDIWADRLRKAKGEHDHEKANRKISSDV